MLKGQILVTPNKKYCYAISHWLDYKSLTYQYMILIIHGHDSLVNTSFHGKNYALKYIKLLA